MVELRGGLTLRGVASLFRYLPTLNDLLRSTVSSFAAFANLVAFIVFLGLAFVIGGRYAFRGDIDPSTRTTFADFGSGTLTAIQLFMSDGWSGIVIAGMASKSSYYGQFFAGLYLLAWFVLGRLIITNLFVAIIIENFEVANTISNVKKPGHLSAMRSFVKVVQRLMGERMRQRVLTKGILARFKTGDDSPKADESDEILQYVSTLKHFEDEVGHTRVVPLERRGTFLTKHLRGAMMENPPLVRTRSTKSMSKKAIKAEREAKAKAMASTKRSNILDEGDNADASHQASWDEAPLVMANSALTLAVGNVDCHQQDKEQKRSSLVAMQRIGSTRDSLDKHASIDAVQQSSLHKHTHTSLLDMLDRKQGGVEVKKDESRSLFLFSADSWVRRFFRAVDKSFVFDMLVYLAIVGSCIILAFTPPAEDWHESGKEFMPLSIRKVASSAFTAFFCFEFLVRVLAHGMVLGSGAYLLDNWNRMDSIVLAFALVDEFGLFDNSSGSSGQVSKVIRLMRALRPLRLMKRNRGMRLVIDALLCTLAPVGYVVTFAAMNLVTFSLVGMALFGGKFKFCSGPGAEYPAGTAACSGLHVTDDGLVLQRVWQSPDFNFDAFGEAMISLFRASDMKYQSVIESAMDVTDYDQSPLQMNSPGSSIFIIVFLIVGALFVMNLFLGFIVDGFKVAKGTDQVEIIYGRFVRMLAQYRPQNADHRHPQNRVSAAFRHVAKSQLFANFSGLCVSLNVLFMVSDHSARTVDFKHFMHVQNLIFFTELVAEIAIFFIAFGFISVMTDVWKVFDVFVAVGTTLGYAVNDPRIAQFAKAFRLMRVSRPSLLPPVPAM